jgi:uncharacterized protein YndB with AHSA1/START domain
MDINIPKEQALELDGVPLIGEVSLSSPESSISNKKIQLSWKALEKGGKVKIWLTATNNFKTGGVDHYQLIGEVPLRQEQFTIDLNILSSHLYKIVLEGPHNTLNHWVELKEM